MPQPQRSAQDSRAGSAAYRPDEILPLDRKLEGRSVFRLIGFGWKRRSLIGLRLIGFDLIVIPFLALFIFMCSEIIVLLMQQPRRLVGQFLAAFDRLFA